MLPKKKPTFAESVIVLGIYCFIGGVVVRAYYELARFGWRILDYLQ